MKSTAFAMYFCLALACAASVQAAAPVVVDFETLRVEDFGLHEHGFTYSEDGYTLNNLSSPYPFATFGTQSPFFPGSTSLFNNTVDGITELVRTGGGPFNLVSIDLAELGSQLPSPLPFTGELLGGGTVNQTFTLDGIGPANGLQTFNFAGFNNVVRVIWTQVDPHHQFDNITIGAVPEPTTIALLFMGAVTFGLGRRASR